MLGKKKSDQSKKVPISAHPVFPVVVALWFAALLGIGSLILPVIIFEKFAVATGLSSILDAAQPPLGTKARLIVAVFAALAGAVAGIIVARKVANAQSLPKEARPARNVIQPAVGSDKPAELKKPISAHEELGCHGLDAPLAQDTAPDDLPRPGVAYSGKRRALAVTDDSGPSDFLELAPLPGGEPTFVTDPFEADDNDSEPLELAELALDDGVSESTNPSSYFSESTPLNITDSQAIEPEDEYRPQTGSQFTDPIEDPIEELRQEFTLKNEPAQEAYNPFAAKADHSQPEHKPFSAPEGMQAAPAFPGHSPASFAESVLPKNALTQNLNELSMAELVERFAMALQSNAQAKHTAAHAPEVEQGKTEQANEQAAPLVFRRANTAATNAVPFGEPAPSFKEAAPLQSVTSTAMTQPMDEQPKVAAAEDTAALPFALRPLLHDDDSDEHDADGHHDDLHGLSLSLSTSNLKFEQSASLANWMKPAESAAQPAIPAGFGENASSAAGSAGQFALPASFGAEAEIDDEDEDEGAYSSLLNMKSQFSAGQDFVRIEDDDSMPSAPEGVVVFPGQDQRRATPATDGPSREPLMDDNAPEPVAFRPFDGPAAENANGGFRQSTNSNAGETERALREALEKLQRMSGAA
ncbi:MAG: hypothetical protein WAT93_08800 [Pontixanthobacter sp.]